MSSFVVCLLSSSACVPRFYILRWLKRARSCRFPLLRILSSSSYKHWLLRLCSCESSCASVHRELATYHTPFLGYQPYYSRCTKDAIQRLYRRGRGCLQLRGSFRGFAIRSSSCCAGDPKSVFGWQHHSLIRRTAESNEALRLRKSSDY